MATRIYLPSSGAAPVTPATWNFPNQINPLTFAGVTTPINSALTTKLEPTGTTNPTYRAMLRYVIGPLAAQSISGTVHGIIKCLESAAAANANLAIAVKIIKPDGTDRAVLLGYVSSDSTGSPYEINTTLMTRRWFDISEVEPITLTTQSAVGGDYLVIELGFRSATGTSRNISLRYGDNGGSDFEDTDGLTTDLNPWIEFSANLFSQIVEETASAIKYKSITTQDQVNEQEFASIVRYDDVVAVNTINAGESSESLSDFIGILAINNLIIEETLYGA